MNINFIRKGISLFLLLFSVTAYAVDIRVNDIQILKSDNATRIIVSVNTPTENEVFTLDNPNRLVVDFDDANLTPQLKASLDQINTENTAIKKIRYGHPESDVLRLVFDMAGPIKFRRYPVSGDDTNFSRLIIDFKAEGNIVRNSVPIIKQAEKKPEKSIITKTVNKSKKKTFIVVVDPGHGGKDPGTIGARGTKEKDVVLAIGIRLANIINKQPNMRAILTRDGDYFVKLRSRLQVARKNNADLFIAIHADSFFHAKYKGVSVYALSSRGATSEAARWLAQRDNYSELGNLDFDDLGDKSVQLRSVLIDLEQTATITDSLHLGSKVLNSLGKVTRLRFARVEQAPFVVLKSPDIPSILIETGFLSNSYEEARLREVDYRNKLARAILDGVKSYVSSNQQTV